MTYTALSGIHKQSVSDVERLFSPQLGEYMHKKGYTFEAEYVTTIRNWRRSHDEKGLDSTWALQVQLPDAELHTYGASSLAQVYL